MSTRIRSDYFGDWQIYALRDPRDRKFYYVGVTTDVNFRLGIHLRQTNNQSLHDWFWGLDTCSLSPELVTLELGTSDQHLARESFWIKKLKAEGQPLLNVIYRGAKRSAETRARISAARSGQPVGGSLTRGESVRESWKQRRLEGKDNRRRI